MKSLVRDFVDHAAWMTGALWLFERRLKRSVAVLMYHRVLPLDDCRDYPFPSLVMPEEVFDRQVQWLASSFNIMPVGAALAAAGELANRGRPIVAITFDDGYADNARAAQIMEAHGVRGTFYVATDFVSCGRSLWFDRAAAIWTRADVVKRREMVEAASSGQPLDVERERSWVETLKRLPSGLRNALIESFGPPSNEELSARFGPMNVATLQSLLQRGHEIGAHTRTHPILTNTTDDELEQEISGSRGDLKSLLGVEAAGFCYPNGDFDERVVDAVQRAGFSYACTTRPGLNRGDLNRFIVRRVNIDPRRVIGSDGRHRSPAFRAVVAGLLGIQRA